MSIAIGMYAFGCSSAKQDPALRPVQNDRQLAAFANETIETQVKSTQQAPEPNLKHHKSSTFDAYQCSSASWVADDLSITYYELEHDVNNNPIPIPSSYEGLGDDGPVPPNTVELVEERPFYRDGYIQFSRDVFRGYWMATVGREDPEVDRVNAMVVQGKFA